MNTTKPFLFSIPATAFLIGLYAFTRFSTGLEGTWNLQSITVTNTPDNGAPAAFTQAMNCTVTFNRNHTVDSNCDDSPYKGMAWNLEKGQVLLTAPGHSKPWVSRIEQLDAQTLVLTTEIVSDGLVTRGAAQFRRQ